MSDQSHTPSSSREPSLTDYVPEELDPEMAANERRAERPHEDDRGITGAVSRIVGSFTRPLMADELREDDPDQARDTVDADERERARRLNDAEQR